MSYSESPSSFQSITARPDCRYSCRSAFRSDGGPIAVCHGSTTTEVRPGATWRALPRASAEGSTAARLIDDTAVRLVHANTSQYLAPGPALRDSRGCVPGNKRASAVLRVTVALHE